MKSKKSFITIVISLFTITLLAACNSPFTIAGKKSSLDISKLGRSIGRTVDNSSLIDQIKVGIADTQGTVIFVGSVSPTGTGTTETTIESGKTYLLGLGVILRDAAGDVPRIWTYTKSFDTPALGGNLDLSIIITKTTLNNTCLNLTELQTAQLTASVASSNAPLPTVTWSSTNTAVATVDTNGLVTAVSAGSATIKANPSDNGFAASCCVTVVALPSASPSTSPTPSPTSTATSTPIPTASPTPTITPTASPTPSPTPTVTPSPSPTVSPSPTPSPTATPSPSPSPSPTSNLNVSINLIAPSNPTFALTGPTTLAKTVGNSILVSATAGFNSYEWQINGITSVGETASSITISSANPSLFIGVNRVTLIVYQSGSGSFYSAEFTFNLTN